VGFPLRGQIRGEKGRRQGSSPGGPGIFLHGWGVKKEIVHAHNNRYLFATKGGYRKKKNQKREDKNQGKKSKALSGDVTKKEKNVLNIEEVKTPAQ